MMLIANDMMKIIYFVMFCESIHELLGLLKRNIVCVTVTTLLK